ncbi:formate transporter FocA [Psychromonas sp. RZ22]|uniref:formate transporter FocA n=1 Tax=Psychromonas algarum TaxID=2555643 RepID=UPI001068B225|nr:formate transporter FocA [Psychromonas sp. RZ22]TEW55642.1 formate transporter FocA [Psychromonas sp. RZ22]
MNNVINNIKKNTSKPADTLEPIVVVSEYGLKKATKSVLQSFGSAIFAGIFISIAFVFYITVTTGADDVAWGFSKLVGGTVFSLGLILVVICGAELFTSTVLTSVAWAQKRISTKQLLSCWGRVYVGNFVGAMIMVLLIYGAKMYLLDGGSWGINVLKVAQHKLHHTWIQAFTLGVLCNLLVCLGVWMTFTTKDVLTKAILLILPVSMFVSNGFEHSIANLFMVPLGILTQNTISPETLASFGYNANTFADLTIHNFIFHNLIPVTLGNIVGGGVIVGLGYWFIYREGPKPTVKQPVKNETVETAAVSNTQVEAATLGQRIDSIMNDSSLTGLTAAQLMDTKAITLTAQQSATSAFLKLSSQKVAGAVVIDEQHKMVGFISEQDLLRAWWSNSFELDNELTVNDVMQTEVLSVTPTQNIAELIEFMSVDKSVLFPVSDSGVLLSNQHLSYNQRLKKAAAKHPSIYPVVDKGIVVGTITRQHITERLLLQLTSQEDQDSAA